MSMGEVMRLNGVAHSAPLDELIVGRNFGFGDGRHGNIVYDGTFPWFRDKPYDRYEIQSTYFEVPAGKTLKPPLESGGLVIYSLSDIVINGTIDMKSRGRHGEIEKKAIKAVTVYGRTFELPLCGGTVASALSGDGGRIYPPTSFYNGGDGRIGNGSYLSGSYSSGGYSPPYCGQGGYYDTHYSIRKGYTGSIVNLFSQLHRQPTGIVILIARGTITIKGKIDCSASPGIAAESGQRGYIEGDYVYAGRGGGGAQSPSGGGSITLIAKTIDRSGGVLDVSGKSYTNTMPGTSLASETTTLTHSNMPGTFQAQGGTGGTGTPSTGFTSQAGGIKEYIYTR